MTIAPGEDVLADDVLTVGTAGAWTAYTPVWTATSGTPAVGSGGSLVGRYKQVGKIVYLAIYKLLGTSPVLGTGAWSYSLPVAASAVSDLIRQGSAYYRDTSATSAGHFLGQCSIQPLLSTTKLFVLGGTNAQAGAATPFAWAATDFAAYTITYEAA